ncbi:hypothetical protein TNCV_2117541 [Trichonephila clavipes]|nr:hypothetical protein TNCV_2117541 [Trichonephila clavipes]
MPRTVELQLHRFTIKPPVRVLILLKIRNVGKPQSPSGHCRELVAGVVELRVRNLVPQKTRLVKGLMHVKSAVVLSPPVDMV